MKGDNVSLHEVNVERVMDDAQRDFISDLLSKARTVNEKTKGHSNVTVKIGDLDVPVRVDDKQLMYIGCALLPNIVNYLVNILPQFLYPYVVAYLQDLSDPEDPVTINDLYELIQTLNK